MCVWSHLIQHEPPLGYSPNYSQIHAQILPQRSLWNVLDPLEALHETERVCKSDGETRLLDHHRCIAPLLLGRVTERIHDGEYERVDCRLYEDPTAVVRRSELTALTDSR